jgi:ABC-type Fe3+-hydroxamate transport system substrate-binding protein
MARRIISLVPSQTELLYDLGLDEEVIGITKFCIHPDKWFRSKIRIGGTKDLHLDKIRGLNPDLIIANKEENEKEQVEKLALEFPVYTSDIKDLEQAIDMIRTVGDLCDRTGNAEKIIETIRNNFSTLHLPQELKKAAYIIWKEPLMTVGGDSFINNMMHYAGFENIFQNKSRYPIIQTEDLKGCEWLLLSSEPYPFRQKHIDAFSKLLPGTKIVLVDGEMFSWYGSRLIHAPAYFTELKKQLQALS